MPEAGEVHSIGENGVNDSEQKLIREMRTVAASHRLNGEPRTCELLERAAMKLEKVLSREPAQSPEPGTKPAELFQPPFSEMESGLMSQSTTRLQYIWTLEGLLRDAATAIEGLAGQQAMPDASHEPVLTRIRSTLTKETKHEG